MTKTLARALSLGLVIVAVSAGTAQAKRHQGEPVQTFDRHSPGGGFSHDATPQRTAGLKQMRRKHQRRYQRDKVSRHYAKHHHSGASASLADVTPQLAAKARELIADCGAKVISGYRPGARVRGYRVASLHARFPAEAIDMTGDTSCIYPRLKGWPGGYSIDYAAVRHIHISLAHDRRERGSRFAHYGTRRYARR